MPSFFLSGNEPKSNLASRPTRLYVSVQLYPSSSNSLGSYSYFFAIILMSCFLTFVTNSFLTLSQSSYSFSRNNFKVFSSRFSISFFNLSLSPSYLYILGSSITNYGVGTLKPSGCSKQIFPSQYSYFGFGSSARRALPSFVKLNRFLGAVQGSRIWLRMSFIFSSSSISTSSLSHSGASFSSGGSSSASSAFFLRFLGSYKPVSA